MSYAAAVSRLLACPFCRELYTDGEAARCKDCGVELQPLEKLPPSHDALLEEAIAAAEAGQLPPEPIPAVDYPLPWTFMGRGRLALMLCGVLGIGMFFAPWVSVVKPDLALLSGFDLAKGRAGWLWSGLAGWLTLIPLVASRRTVNQMRGVRAVCAMFASMTLVETVMLLARPPESHPRVPVEIHWQWGLYTSLGVAALGVLLSLRFGGKPDDLRDLPLPGTASDTDETMH